MRRKGGKEGGRTKKDGREEGKKKKGKEGGRTRKDGREERKEPRRKEVGWRTQEGSGEGGSEGEDSSWLMSYLSRPRSLSTS